MGSLDQIAAARKRGGAVAASGGGTLDQIAAQRKVNGGSLNEPVDVTPPQHKAGGGGGGFFGSVGHVVASGASGLKNAAYDVVGGVYDLGKLEAQAIKHDVQHPNLGKHESLHDFLHGNNNPASKKLGQVEGQMGRDTVKSLTDPSYIKQHPADTVLNLLAIASGGAGAAERLGYAAKAAKAGETADAAKALLSPIHKPPVGERVLKVGDLQVRGHYSHAAGSRAVQKVADAALRKAADANLGVSVGKRELSAENFLHGRAAKWMARNNRVADATARAAGTRLAKIGASLKPDELRALRLVAEETPVDRRLAAQTLRQGAAQSAKEAARHQERIDLTKAAMQHLTTDVAGKPVFRAEATKLRKVYDLLKQVSADREHMLENIGVLDKATADAAKLKTARVAAGAKMVDGELVGANDITVSPDAVHIGNPVERTKIAGAPKVSSARTFGHTRKLSSLKASTGGAVTHALERNDVTNIAAERHAEAVRLSKIDRVRQQVAKAGSAVPRRANDVFVWTDKITKNERVPAEVRKYLDNPESIRQLPDKEQASILDQLRKAVFEQHNWQADAEARQQFEQLAKQGKGVFVPRKLLGEHAKATPTVPGSGFLDAVNNAQKAGLVYLKVNYPVVQGVSNVAMNLIHQGFAAPVRLTQAVKLDHAIGGDLAAVVDDIMGEGAVQQAAFQGRGAISRASQGLARKMSVGVDKPARRAAFLHEAIQAGYNTPAKLKQLLTADQHAGDLGEVAQRAKEAIVDYEDLGPNEKAIVRRLIFVYPWQKGATKYAAHFLRDHPVQAAALNRVGQHGNDVQGQQLGAVPSYLQGVFNAGGGLVNPAGVNFFQTPAQIGEGLAGVVSGNPAQRSAGLDFLAPAPAVIAGLLSGTDSIGRPLKGNVLAKTRDLTLAQTPISQLARAALGSHSSTARKVFGSQQGSKTFPNVNDAYWRFLLGGLYPRQFSRGALNQNAAREKTGR